MTAPTKKARPSYDPDSPRAIAFCEHYVVSLVPTKAAEDAGYSKKRAKQTASELMQLPGIQARIKALLEARSSRTKIDADAVITRFWQMANADVNELVEYRRTCCRHCWGLHHDYQRTSREIYEAIADWMKRKDRKPEDVFAFATGDGGPGWDPRRDPNPACPECFGEGREHVHFKDTRTLSPGARAIYAGVKTTKEGIEVKTHSPYDALVSVARHLGLFKDKLELEAGESLEAILAKSWSAPAAAGGHA